MKSLRNQSAEERAKVSAPPGYSEHSTGFAVDFADLTRPQTELSEESFETTPGFAWLKNNAHRYHFTLSFPRANAQGLSYEPWHWRFEGSAQALSNLRRLNVSNVPRDDKVSHSTACLILSRSGRYQDLTPMSASTTRAAIRNIAIIAHVDHGKTTWWMPCWPSRAFSAKARLCPLA